MTIESTRLKSSAHQKLSTINPGTIYVVSITRVALIIRVNSPKVIILIGRVRSRKSGFKTAFIIPKTRAVTRAVVKLATWIPGNR